MAPQRLPRRTKGQRERQAWKSWYRWMRRDCALCLGLAVVLPHRQLLLAAVAHLRWKVRIFSFQLEVTSSVTSLLFSPYSLFWKRTNGRMRYSRPNRTWYCNSIIRTQALTVEHKRTFNQKRSFHMNNKKQQLFNNYYLPLEKATLQDPRKEVDQRTNMSDVDSCGCRGCW